MIKNAIVIVFLYLMVIYPPTMVMAGRIGIENNNDAYKACLVYEGHPVFAYGPSPQWILTYLPKGNGNDLIDWCDWAQKFGITNVRSYPPAIIVEEPAQNVFNKSNSEQEKFDLNDFNNEYFKELRKACMLLRKQGIIVHLQLWQAVYWKKLWQDCYYNLKNNCNPDISAHAGPGEFVTMKNPALLDHQKRYVVKILDATGDLGNVFYDIMNEIGNGTGKSEEWVWEIIRTVNKWEKENSIDLLLTLNDEGGMRMDKFSLECKGLDLIVKDLGRYDEHIETRMKYSKPTISVRNIDWDYKLKKRRYFAEYDNLEVNQDENLQTRGRKYWWRMFMAGVQSAGGYADTVLESDKPFFEKVINKITDRLGMKQFYPSARKASYRLNQTSEQNFIHFKEFVEQISNYEQLRPLEGILLGHPVQNSYSLQSERQAIIYLESPSGEAGYQYDEKEAKLHNLMLDDGHYTGIFYFPSDGRSQKFSIELRRGEGRLVIPAFKDDLAMIIRSD